jgi:hypothetical protein
MRYLYRIKYIYKKNIFKKEISIQKVQNGGVRLLLINITVDYSTFFSFSNGGCMLLPLKIH